LYVDSHDVAIGPDFPAWDVYCFGRGDWQAEREGLALVARAKYMSLRNYELEAVFRNADEKAFADSSVSTHQGYFSV
jgi:hypothetical protein